MIEPRISLGSFAKRRRGDAALDAAPARARLSGYRMLAGLGERHALALPAYLAQALTYPLIKALDRLAQGRDDVYAFERGGTWRIAAAEHALDRPGEVAGLPLRA